MSFRYRKQLILMEVCMVTKVYVTEQVKVGREIVGWNSQKQDLVVTTPVTKVEYSREQSGLVAETEAGGCYLVTNKR